MASKDRKKLSQTLGQYLRYSHLGMQFFVAVALFTGAGYWIDKKFKTEPIATLVGLAIGFAAGFYSLYRTLFRSERRKNESKSDSNTDND